MHEPAKLQGALKVQLPAFLDFADADDEAKKCAEFRDRVIVFQKQYMGNDNFKVPSIGGRELDLCRFFKAVIIRGGYQRVSSFKLWKEIVNEFEIPSSCTSASFTLRNHYNRCLLQFERQFYHNQGQVDSVTGLNADGVAPLLPGVPALASDSNYAFQPSGFIEPSRQSRRENTQMQAQYAENSRAVYPLVSNIVTHMEQSQHHQHPISAASINVQSSFTDQTLPVTLTYTLAETKRLVLAFESRIQPEITWALNTLLILSCNTNQNLTLESQPYLVESLSNYLQFCIERIDSLDLTCDVIKKDQKLNITQVQSFVDAYQTDQVTSTGKLSYRNFGMFTRVVTASKHQDVQSILKSEDIASLFQGQQRKRGRKTKTKLLEEQNALDELRKKRKKLVTVLHQEVSELTLINHLQSIIQIIRNLSFVKQNEHYLIKCFKIVDIVVSLFVDLADREITSNCLDIITNLGKHIILSEIAYGSELIDTLFQVACASQVGHLPGMSADTVDQCFESLRRLSLTGGNEIYLENLRDEDIQLIVNQLVSPNIETREAALEILCTISDKETNNATLKLRIVSQQRCIERLIGLIAAGACDDVCGVTEEKVSKLAALTLGNLNMAAGNRALIVPYEQELALIASSDERTCKIVSEILGDLDSYQVYSK